MRTVVAKKKSARNRPAISRGSRAAVRVISTATFDDVLPSSLDTLVGSQARGNPKYPASWRSSTLGALLPLKYGKARSSQFGYPRPDTRAFGSNGAFGTFDRALTTAPTLIVGRKGAAGAVHFSSDPCWPIDTAFYAEGGEHTHLPFFRYLLESLQLVRLDRSTAIPSLSRDDYNSHVVHCPASLEEQRRIVAEIEKQFTRLEVGVAALRRVQANLKRYRAAVLKAACEGRLVPTEAELCKTGGQNKFETGEELLARILAERRNNWQSRGNYTEPAAPNVKTLSTLPKGWIWARAEQLCTFITKGTTPSSDKMQENVGEVPFIKVYNLTFTGALNLDYKPVFVDAQTHGGELARSEIRSGDVLINIVGPPLGQVSIVPTTVARANINQAIARFRAVFPECRKQLAIWLMTEHIIGWAVARAKATAGQVNLTLELCRDLPIPLPPLAEQTRIIAEVERRLSVVEELEAVVNANLLRATRLRQSILQKAFTGEF